MNAPSETATGHGVLPLVMSMFGTRLELAAIDVEAHLQATLVAALTAFVAVVLGLIAFAFIGIAVIVFFWETHRVAAAAGVTLGYATIAGAMAWQARSGWKKRPDAFAATMRELALDAQAFQGKVVNRGSVTQRTRREELLAQCQHERYELVAATATTLALIPRARRVAHWIRATSRMLRVLSASMHRD